MTLWTTFTHSGHFASALALCCLDATTKFSRDRTVEEIQEGRQKLADVLDGRARDRGAATDGGAGGKYSASSDPGPHDLPQ